METELSVDWLLVLVELSGVVALPPSCCVAGSGVLPVLLEQATRLPDKSKATAAMETHLFFMFIPLSFRMLCDSLFGHNYMVTVKDNHSVREMGKNHEQSMKKV